VIGPEGEAGVQGGVFDGLEFAQAGHTAGGEGFSDDEKVKIGDGGSGGAGPGAEEGE